MQQSLRVLRTTAELRQLEAYIDQFEYLAYDTETTGVEKDSEIIGFSLAGELGVGYYVILAYWDVAAKKLIWLETKNTCKPILEKLKSKKLIMQNAPFDCAMTNNNFGIELMPSVHTDTLPLAHLLDENRSNGLKELGVYFFGESAKEEQELMKQSIVANGGECTKKVYELYKADCELIAKYGAKDAILTLAVFYELIPTLFDEGLDKFYYEDETMPLLRGPTYHLNTTGLKIDQERLKALELELREECMLLEEDIRRQVFPHVKEKYPGTSETKTFNINSSQQVAWLLFIKLGNEFNKLTKSGRGMAKELVGRIPYSAKQKRAFIQACEEIQKPPQKYLKCDKATLTTLAIKYPWVAKLLKWKASDKLLKTYVLGIQSRMRYGIIHPSFLQHGTTSGRYSCKNPNFQNLPRTDKRVKKCVISRPGKVFVGADYAQLEPRVFASFAKDERLLKCFKDKQDFYSVIGIPVFKKFDAVALKEGSPDAFGVKYPVLRDISKGVALSATYGTTAFKMSELLRDEEGNPLQPAECQIIIDSYFEQFPQVQELMLESHEMAKKNGVVYNLFGRPRRIPEAKKIKLMYGKTPHDELPYLARNLLNLSINHRIQSTGASIINRAAIRFIALLEEHSIDAKLVSQIHDELVAECWEKDQDIVKHLLKLAMETTVTLPGVDLIAEPKVAKNLADLK